MPVGMAHDDSVNTAIALLAEVKIQARVLIPVLRALRTELGEDTANRLVRTALRDWSRRLVEELGRRLPGRPREKWETARNALYPRIGDDIDIEMLRQEPDAIEFNVTGCRYADFFRRLNEPELGAVLLCETDFHRAELGSPEVELHRSQTIMEGARTCAFRYRLKRTKPSSDEPKEEQR